MDNKYTEMLNEILGLLEEMDRKIDELAETQQEVMEKLDNVGCGNEGFTVFES